MKVNSKNNINYVLLASFILMFIYGALLLMISYTSTSLTRTLNINVGETIFFILPQSVGLIFSTILTKIAIKKQNSRHILIFSYFFMIIFLSLISQFDIIAGGINNATGISNNYKFARALFIIFTFGFGLCIGTTVPITSSYLVSKYRHRDKNTYISLVNGVYGFGAGIVPLIVTRILFTENRINDPLFGEEFSSFRPFYYVAIGLSIIAFITAFFFDYIHEYSSIHNKKNQHHGIIKYKTLLYLTILLIIIMFSYRFFETICNYSFTKFVILANNNDDEITRRIYVANESFGIFFLAKGMTRIFMGLVLNRKFSHSVFIAISTFIVIVGFILTTVGLLNLHPNYAYLIAFIFGIGLGNVWPLIINYGNNFKKEKAVYFALILNIASMVCLPFSQLISALLLNGVTTYKDAGYYLLGVIAIIFTIILIITIVILHLRLKKIEKQYPKILRQ